ncbi:hypothetical protein RRG08_052809 [Elysia crispata]|uniref:Uncharacterized protein n=1 Tax=Elysia crispata TaxID=231223 RepID=A0AAE1B7S8_9GAST|nr:hypothetical protein RRG08_052809 [Elysia crispata]
MRKSQTYQIHQELGESNPNKIFSRSFQNGGDQNLVPVLRLAQQTVRTSGFHFRRKLSLDSRPTVVPSFSTTS